MADKYVTKKCSECNGKGTRQIRVTVLGEYAVTLQINASFTFGWDDCSGVSAKAVENDIREILTREEFLGNLSDDINSDFKKPQYTLVVNVTKLDKILKGKK